MAKSRSGAATAELTRVQVHLGVSQLADLDGMVEETGLARNTQVRLAVRQYLERARRRAK